VPFEAMAQRLPLSCPRCLGENIQRTPLPASGWERRCGRGFRGGRR
jgi:hypothetical protein